MSEVVDDVKTLDMTASEDGEESGRDGIILIILAIVIAWISGIFG